MPLPTSAELADDHLEPVRAWAHANHGSIVKIAALMRKKTSTPISRQSVCRWLNKDKGKRQEPKLGIALLIASAVEELQTASQSDAPAA